MPKPLFNNKQSIKQLSIDINASNNKNKSLNPLLAEKRLRNKRTLEYVNYMKKLDIHGVEINQSDFNRFIETMKNEFPDIPIELLPIGIVGACYLGDPYEVHTIDFIGEIVKHYKDNEPLPPMMEKARSLAIHGDYEFIEIYVDCLRAVKADGSVYVVK